MTLQNIVQNKQRVDDRTRLCLFFTKFCSHPLVKVQTFEITLALLILLEALQSYSFLMSQNFDTQGCQWYQGLTRFLWIKGTVEQGLGHLLIMSSSPQFFNKTISSSVSLNNCSKFMHAW